MEKARDPVILHVDCNAYYASVEELFEPELKKVPMAICGDPESRRGIILAKNELAKGFGIKTAETIWEAKKKCPHLTLRAPRHRVYREYCEKINAIYERYTDRVERAGLDESYLDCTRYIGSFGGDPEKLARDILRRVPDETGLTVSIGVSWNKAFAKLGSDYKKPNAYTIITRDNYKDIVWPLPVTALLFVGRATADTLIKYGINTIGELAQTDEETLYAMFGKPGRQLYVYANGLDSDPVKKTGEADPIKSVGNGITFKRDLVSRADVKTAITALSDEVAERMRREGVKCMTVQVTIKDIQLKVITRQKALEVPSYLALDISKAAMELVEKNWKAGKPIRMLTVTAQKLVPEERAGETAVQMSLFGEPEKPATNRKRESLEKTIDRIRDKYGSGSIKPASVHHNDLGISEGETISEDKSEKPEE